MAMDRAQPVRLRELISWTDANENADTLAQAGRAGPALVLIAAGIGKAERTLGRPELAATIVPSSLEAARVRLAELRSSFSALVSSHGGEAVESVVSELRAMWRTSGPGAVSDWAVWAAAHLGGLDPRLDVVCRLLDAAFSFDEPALDALEAEVPRSAYVHLLRADAREGAGEIQAALAHRRRALLATQDPEGRSATERLVDSFAPEGRIDETSLVLGAARNAASLGQWASVLELTGPVLDACPEHPDALRLAAHSGARLFAPDRARSDLDKAIRACKPYARPYADRLSPLEPGRHAVGELFELQAKLHAGLGDAEAVYDALRWLVFLEPKEAPRLEADALFAPFGSRELEGIWARRPESLLTRAERTRRAFGQAIVEVLFGESRSSAADRAVTVARAREDTTGLALALSLRAVLRHDGPLAWRQLGVSDRDEAATLSPPRGSLGAAALSLVSHRLGGAPVGSSLDVDEADVVHVFALHLACCVGALKWLRSMEALIGEPVSLGGEDTEEVELVAARAWLAALAAHESDDAERARTWSRFAVATFAALSQPAKFRWDERVRDGLREAVARAMWLSRAGEPPVEIADALRTLGLTQLGFAWSLEAIRDDLTALERDAGTKEALKALKAFFSAKRLPKQVSASSPLRDPSVRAVWDELDPDELQDVVSMLREADDVTEALRALGGGVTGS